MTKLFLYTAVLLSVVTVAQADVFTFSYSGSGLSASGTVNAAAIGGGEYSITGLVSGSRDGQTITSAAGDFYYTGSPSIFSNAELTLGVNGLIFDLVVDNALDASELAVSNKGTTTDTTLTSFSINRASVPEPSALLLLATMGLGVWLLARKLHLKKTL